MTNVTQSPEEQELRAKVKLVRSRLEALSADLRAVDDEIESLAPQRAQHELLDQACGSLEKLGELGAGKLFWGDRMEPGRVAEQLREVRGRVNEFQAQIGELDDRRGAIQTKVHFEEENLEVLGENLYDLREEEERRKLEWVVERDESLLPRRPHLMAWARGSEDDKRFRKSLAASLLISLPLGVLLPMIPLPVPKVFQAEDMPKRVVQFVRQEKAKLIPPPPVVAQKPQEKKRPEEEKPKPPKKPDQPPPKKAAPSEGEAQARMGEPKPSVPSNEPPPAGPASAQKRVQKAGILAFKNEFASLAKDKVAPRLGANARYRQGNDDSRGQAPMRSMLTTNAPGSSGGIRIASLSLGLGSRGGGGGGGGGGPGGVGGMQGVPLGRETSPIAGIGPGDRPLARGGPGASRTDEEIQIVFDRHKAQFYRLYNRELRKDPTLRGQMVLRLTIEPDGSVSMCKLQSSDMNAPDLAAQIVSIVLTINFGAKEVDALTIVYPIDFLPAST